MPGRGVEDAYYYGWANYWMQLLDAGRPPYETVPHAQSAPNNFLGLHLHDTQYYLNVGSYVAAELHPTYAHGNVLMWKHAWETPMMQRSSYWKAQHGRGLFPDNMGSGWIASSTCDELSVHVEGAWNIFRRSGNRTFAQLAYELYRGALSPLSGNISDTAQLGNWGGSGKRLNGLIAMAKLAAALGHADDAAAWHQVLESVEAPRFRRQWGEHGHFWGNSAEGLESMMAVVAQRPFFDDAWADTLADDWLLNADYGFYPPNRSFGAPLLAFANNVTNMGPWAAHTTKTVEVIDGLFRHGAGAAAINLTLGHIEAMQRDFGFTVYPEAWDRDGGLWGDQWYNWGSSLAVLLPLQRMIGVDFDVVGGVLTVCDYIAPGWSRAQAHVPIAGEWAEVVVERLNATAKRITVRGNPLKALHLQPWLEGHRLRAAEPAGYAPDAPAGHVGWSFTGAAAADAAVTVSW